MGTAERIAAELMSTNLPLLARDTGTAVNLAAAEPDSDRIELGGFTLWGISGDTVTASDFSYNAAAKTLTVNTDKQFAMKTPDQTIVETGDQAGTHANPVAVGIVVPAGRTARITLAGVGIRAATAMDVQAGGTCYLTLADSSYNSLVSTGEVAAGIHCPIGATLVIDDTIANRDSTGRPIVPEKGVVPADITLENSAPIKKGDPLTVMDAADPGALFVWSTGKGTGAGIGGNSKENYGSLTINGGIITARCSIDNVNVAYQYVAPGIGHGGWAPRESREGSIVINGGRITAIGAGHGAGIGGGSGGSAGIIVINGGYVISRGGTHAPGFGAGCGGGNNPQDSDVNEITLTGGTLLPTGGPSGTTVPNVWDIDAPNGTVTITGGSIGTANKGKGLTFRGTAQNGAGEEISMIEVDLSSDVGESIYPITNWQLTIDGQPYDYGAPAEFDRGHLYLWLPAKAKEESEVSVSFTYLDTDHLDKDGNPTEVTPLPLFRLPDNQSTPGSSGDSKLRRYADFVLPNNYLETLVKDYDGLPFPSYSIDPDHPLPTMEEIGKNPDTGAPIYRELTDPTAVTYRYRLYDKKDGSPLGPEANSGALMPADAGTMKFVMTSTEYSDSTDPALKDFRESYWGHRATGWCEIRPVPSEVTAVRATWADGSDAASPQRPQNTLNVEIDVASGPATASTCKAPEGSVQLYVDGKPVGEPVAIDFSASGNAKAIADADGREHTALTIPLLAGDAMEAGSIHTISARYLPAKNYLESADPAEADVPSAEVSVLPDASIAPAPALTKAVENLTHPDGPTQAGDRLRYTITASNAAAGSLWTDVVVSDPLPACLELDERSVRLASASFTGAPSKVAGRPAAGQFSLSDPGAEDTGPMLSVGAGPVSSAAPAVVTFECEVGRGIDFATAAAEELALANVARADGTRPDPDGPDAPMPDPNDPGEPLPVAPEPTDPATPPGPGRVVPADPGAGDVRITKAVENLTRADGTTRVGDTLRYEIRLRNAGAPDSALYDALVSDPLPAGIEPVAGTLRLSGPGAAGPSLPVPDSAYDRAGRTVAVSVGDLWGGQEWALSFECEVGAGAVGADNANVALAYGTPPSRDPGRDPASPARGPGEPAGAPETGADPAAQSDPALPPELVPDDPAAGDVSIAKTAENASRGDGTTRVGDTVRYEVRLRNGTVGTGWIDAVVRDDVPRGLEPVSGTIRLALPGGREVTVDDRAYDPETRILAVACGRLYGGQEVALSFDALVTAEAVGADIGNVATGYGTLPSQWEPGSPELEPGAPFSPPGGWGAWERGRQKVASEPAYPPGVDRLGGVLPGEADERTTIARKLAQTGDAVSLALLAPAALALAACAALLAARRKRRGRC